MPLPPLAPPYKGGEVWSKVPFWLTHTIPRRALINFKEDQNSKKTPSWLLFNSPLLLKSWKILNETEAYQKVLSPRKTRIIL